MSVSPFYGAAVIQTDVDAEEEKQKLLLSWRPHVTSSYTNICIYILKIHFLLFVNHQQLLLVFQLLTFEHINNVIQYLILHFISNN